MYQSNSPSRFTQLPMHFNNFCLCWELPLIDCLEVCWSDVPEESRILAPSPHPAPHDPGHPLLQAVVFSLDAGCSWKQRCLPATSSPGVPDAHTSGLQLYLTAHSCFFNYMQRQAEGNKHAIALRPCSHLWEKAELLLPNGFFSPIVCLPEVENGCPALPEHSYRLSYFCLVFLHTLSSISSFLQTRANTHAHTMLAQGHCRKPKTASDQKKARKTGV